MRFGPKKNYLREALERVIAYNGVASAPNGTNSASLQKAWQKAVRDGLIERISGAEICAYLDNRKAVRTVLLGMLEQAATENDLHILDWRETPKPSLGECTDALQGVVYDVAVAKQGWVARYTLTKRGIDFLDSLDNDASIC